MGVRGLKTFIENNPDLVTSDYQLQDTHLIIDANNIKSQIFLNCHGYDRADLFGGDMVRFGEAIRTFLDNLVRADVTPIFVYDGAKDVATNDKSATQLKRCQSRFDQIKNFYNNGYMDNMIPRNTAAVFSSIINEYEFKIIACMYEADNELARLSNHYKGPILSNDSDFFLMNLDYGVISFDTGDFMKPIRSNHEKSIKRPVTCRLFTQDSFVQMFPGLDKRCLPILGILAGNDYVSEDAFEHLMTQLPSHTIREAAGLSAKQFKERLSQSHQKILKVLYFLCDKTPEQAVNSVCAKFAKDKRPGIKGLIKDSQKFYDVPASNEFTKEIRRLCLIGSKTTFKSRTSQFEEAVERLSKYIIKCLEDHAMTFRILEMMNRNLMFLSPVIEDFDQANSTEKFLPFIYGVVLRLLRTHKNEQRPIVLYDRIGRSYEKIVIKQVTELNNFGPLDYIVYDLVTMSEETRSKLLLATFSQSLEDFDHSLGAYCTYFDYPNAQQAVYIKLMFKFIDRINSSRRLPKKFKQAVFTSFIYYVFDKDTTYKQVCGRDRLQTNLYYIDKFRLHTPPRGNRYDMRLMHYLSQLSAAINGFIMLNSLLAEPLPRMRLDLWFNSCLIYNLTDSTETSRRALHNHQKTMILFE